MPQGLQIGFEIAGEQQVKLGISRIRGPVSDLRGIWEKFHLDFIRVENEQFFSEGSDGRSGSWKTLTKKYQAWKESKVPGLPIMVYSGALRNSLIKTQGWGHIYRTTPMSMEVGTSRPEGWWHFQGIPRGGGKVVRKVIDISDRQETEYFGRSLVQWGEELRKEWDRGSLVT